MHEYSYRPGQLVLIPLERPFQPSHPIYTSRRFPSHFHTMLMPIRPPLPKPDQSLLDTPLHHLYVPVLFLRYLEANEEPGPPLHTYASPRIPYHADCSAQSDYENAVSVSGPPLALVRLFTLPRTQAVPTKNLLPYSIVEHVTSRDRKASKGADRRGDVWGGNLIWRQARIGSWVQACQRRLGYEVVGGTARGEEDDKVDGVWDGASSTELEQLVDVLGAENDEAVEARLVLGSAWSLAQSMYSLTAEIGQGPAELCLDTDDEDDDWDDGDVYGDGKDAEEEHDVQAIVHRNDVFKHGDDIKYLLKKDDGVITGWAWGKVQSFRVRSPGHTVHIVLQSTAQSTASTSTSGDSDGLGPGSIIPLQDLVCRAYPRRSPRDLSHTQPISELYLRDNAGTQSLPNGGIEVYGNMKAGVGAMSDLPEANKAAKGDDRDGLKTGEPGKTLNKAKIWSERPAQVFRVGESGVLSIRPRAPRVWDEMTGWVEAQYDFRARHGTMRYIL